MKYKETGFLSKSNFNSFFFFSLIHYKYYNAYRIKARNRLHGKNAWLLWPKDNNVMFSMLPMLGYIKATVAHFGTVITFNCVYIVDSNIQVYWLNVSREKIKYTIHIYIHTHTCTWNITKSLC